VKEDSFLLQYLPAPWNDLIVKRETRYDCSITTFSADGRLVQVEYGMEASARGSTVAALEVSKLGICWVAKTSSFGKVHRINQNLAFVGSPKRLALEKFIASIIIFGW
jgi:hypothetical protein